MLKFGVVALRPSIDSTLELRTSSVLERALSFAPKTEFEEAEAPEKPSTATLNTDVHFMLALVMMVVLERKM